MNDLNLDSIDQCQPEKVYAAELLRSFTINMSF